MKFSIKIGVEVLGGGPGGEGGFVGGGPGGACGEGGRVEGRGKCANCCIVSTSKWTIKSYFGLPTLKITNKK